MSYSVVGCAGCAGLGADAAGESRSVRELQQILNARGFTAGTADGLWGSNTRTAFVGALNAIINNTATTEALRNDARGYVVVAAGWPNRTESVPIPSNIWEKIQALPRTGTSPTPSTTEPRTPVEEPAALLPGGGGPDLSWLPWAIGGAALLGVGAFFLIYKPKRKGAPVGSRGRRVRRNSRRRRSMRRNTRVKSQAWHRGFDAGNYDGAYSGKYAPKPGDVPFQAANEYRAGYVLGYYSSYELKEVPEKHRAQVMRERRHYGV